LSSQPAIEKPIKRIPRSREIAAIGLFGALSIILTIISNLLVKIAFVPPVSYLLFDFGEIPVMISFLIIGPRSGFTVAVIEWLSLNLLPTSIPLLGPLFKFMSVSLTVAGLWIGWKLFRTSDSKIKLGVSSVVSAILRAAIMTIPNAALLVLIFGLPPFSAILYFYLELTAIFNILQIPFDLIPTYVLVQLPQVKHMLRKNGMTWFESGVSKTIK
jgi:riboflavin transporter FmnP